MKDQSIDAVWMVTGYINKGNRPRTSLKRMNYLGGVASDEDILSKACNNKQKNM